MSYNKTKAAQLREVAQMLDEDGYEKASGHLRSTADELDPPQPEWQDGDLVRGKGGMLWERSFSRWHNTMRMPSLTDKELVGKYGPLRRVYLADPDKGEVVVSIEGLDKNILRASLDYSDRWVGRRVADAAQAAGLLDEEA